MKKVIITIVLLVVVIGGIAYVLSGNKKKNQEKTDFVAKGNGAIAVNIATVAFAYFYFLKFYFHILLFFINTRAKVLTPLIIGLASLSPKNGIPTTSSL